MLPPDSYPILGIVSPKKASALPRFGDTSELLAIKVAPQNGEHILYIASQREINTALPPVDRALERGILERAFQ